MCVFTWLAQSVFGRRLPMLDDVELDAPCLLDLHGAVSASIRVETAGRCLVARRSRESVNGRRPPPTAATGCATSGREDSDPVYSARRIVMRATGLRQSYRAALRFPMP